MFAGTEFVLTVDISFNNNSFVDVDLAFVIEWNTQSNVSVNYDRITISPVNSLGMASLTYSPIATSDSGLITANVTVSPSDDSMYIQLVTAASFHNVIIYGEESISMHYILRLNITNCHLVNFHFPKLYTCASTYLDYTCLLVIRIIYVMHMSANRYLQVDEKNFKGTYRDCRKNTGNKLGYWYIICIRVCACSISVLHEQ